jgi:3-hydroxyacyl-CoA dehydrogenase
VNRSLVNIFFLTDRNKKDTGLEGAAAKSVSPREIGSAAVIGAGIMGAGIAAATLKREIPTVLADAAPAALARGARLAVEEAAYSKAAKGADPAKLLTLAPLLTATTDDHALASRDLVIEAVVENADVKRDLYRRIEPLLKETAILASNTSTIPISYLAENLGRPEQFCGIHFFNPVRRMKLVEVIRGQRTSDETVATAVAYAKRVGKSPIVVNDGPGFLVNRLLFPYMNEALNLLNEGATLEEVDRAAKKFGMPMGPITLYDVVGLDTALYAGGVMQRAFPDRITDTPVLAKMVEAGRLGQKNGLGFFSYKNKKQRAAPDPAVEQLLAPLRGATSGGDAKKFTTDQLIYRLFLPMLLEATLVLADGIVRDARDVDLGLIFGLGFPPFKGGLLFWADRVGAAKLVEMLKPYEALGARFQPTPLLLEMAASGKKFYS